MYKNLPVRLCFNSSVAGFMFPLAMQVLMESEQLVGFITVFLCNISTLINMEGFSTETAFPLAEYMPLEHPSIYI